MRKQIVNRLGVAHIRDTVQQFVAGEIDRHQAMESLQIGKSQLYELRASYLAAKAAGKSGEWAPGSSGGNHMPQWSEESQEFLRKVHSPGGDAKRYSHAFAASEGFTGETPLEDVNDHLACLIDYRNGFEKHRDLGDTPLHAWEDAVKEGRCKIRQPPTDGWWELIWSEWKGMMIGPRGRLVVGDTLCTTECANGTRVWCCHHLDGTISLVMNKPEKGVGPKIVFTNNPKIRKSR